LAGPRTDDWDRETSSIGPGTEPRKPAA